jgi:hypothetical protein
MCHKVNPQIEHDPAGSQKPKVAQMEFAKAPLVC